MKLVLLESGHVTKWQDYLEKAVNLMFGDVQWYGYVQWMKHGADCNISILQLHVNYFWEKLLKVYNIRALCIHKYSLLLLSYYLDPFNGNLY